MTVFTIVYSRKKALSGKFYKKLRYCLTANLNAANKAVTSSFDLLKGKLCPDKHLSRKAAKIAEK
ncbi:MAG: hypothetical protein IPL32_14105 [Chloracidobacterium sp.]|nr:hypothetical protein [Chloracidobacterium sp.]